MTFFFEILIGGLLSGLMYSLVALGFVLIYKASGVFNFAQGAMVYFAALAVVGLLGMVRATRDDDVEESLGRGERAALASRFALRVQVPPHRDEIFLNLLCALKSFRHLIAPKSR